MHNAFLSKRGDKIILFLLKISFYFNKKVYNDL